MVNIKRALTIPGWMGEEELTWLAERASESKDIVEVGCWMGRTTVALADNTLGRVWAVDSWRGSDEHGPELKDKGENWLYDKFWLHAITPRLPLMNISPIRLLSLDAASCIKDGMKLRFDMIFLDASHDYESVKSDILAWRPLLTPGGLLCGHDFRPAWPGVEQAVKELVSDFKLVEPTTRCAIWYWRSDK